MTIQNILILLAGCLASIFFWKFVLAMLHASLETQNDFMSDKVDKIVAWSMCLATILLAIVVSGLTYIFAGHMK